MQVEVYVDVIFLINFIMDFILLITVKKVLRYICPLLRVVLGAAVGAVGACLFAVIPEINHILRFLLAYLLLSYFMIVVTFGKNKLKEQLRAVVLLYISTFFLGGLLNSLYYYTDFGLYLMNNTNSIWLFIGLLTGMAGIYVFIRFLRKLRVKVSELYQTDLMLNGKTVKAVGFLDTGNCLRDPYFGKPVIITEYTVIEPLLTNSQNTMLRKLLGDSKGGVTSNKMSTFNDMSTSGDLCTSSGVGASDDVCTSGDVREKEEYLPIRLIPFHSVGKDGMLPAFELDKIILKEEKEETVREKVLIAVSRQKLSVCKDYQIILHKEIM